MSPAPLQRVHCSERLTVMFVVNPLIASSNERLSGISMSAPLCGCGRGGSFSFAAPPPNKSAKMSRKLLPPPDEVELPPQSNPVKSKPGAVRPPRPMDHQHRVLLRPLGFRNTDRSDRKQSRFFRIEKHVVCFRHHLNVPRQLCHPDLLQGDTCAPDDGKLS
jgi:hypothetical protein